MRVEDGGCISGIELLWNHLPTRCHNLGLQCLQASLIVLRLLRLLTAEHRLQLDTASRIQRNLKYSHLRVGWHSLPQRIWETRLELEQLSRLSEGFVRVTLHFIMPLRSLLIDLITVTCNLESTDQKFHSNPLEIGFVAFPRQTVGLWIRHVGCRLGWSIILPQNSTSSHCCSL